MARYGTAETIALLHGSGNTSVWAARMAGDAAGSPLQCVKRVELTDRELAERDASAAEHLLVGAAVQQAMCFRSVAWAPVYHLGTHGTDAFYVTDRFARSAQSLIDAEARLTPAELRTILTAVVDGLIELHVHYGRPHANLKPSNVLIGERIRPGTVCLSDPAAINDAVPSLGRAPDARAIGQLLFALVTHRPRTAARWPLPRDPAWDGLGASGPEWFALCESLLHPLAPSSLDLDDLLTRIIAIRPTRRRLRRALAAAPVAAALALACYPFRAQAQHWCGVVAGAVEARVQPAQPRPTAEPIARARPTDPRAWSPTIDGSLLARSDRG
jgi:hypothetical protein